MVPRRLLPLALVVLPLGCDSTPLGPYGMTEPIPALASVELTDTATLAPITPRLDPPDSRSPADPTFRQDMLDEGYGEEMTDAGEPHLTRGDPPATVGPNARLLVRFAHMPDLQLADDESPTRVANFDAPGLTSGAYRPQEGYGCHMLNAMVRTLNAVHAQSPLDFVLLGGDNADNAQKNEVQWVLQLLSGSGLLECDSGADDDPIYGANNDAKDPFYTFGLDVPWYWVMGNHDVLRQGNFLIDDATVAESMGDQASFGTVDWGRPGAPIVTGTVVPDPERQHLYPDETIALVKGHGDGHGMAGLPADATRATYTFDVPNSLLRFLVHDTTSDLGGADGLIHRPDIQAGGALYAALEQAVTDGRWVVLASHHAASSLGTSFSGNATDAISGQEWADFLSNYPNVLFSIVGHSHLNRIRELTGVGPGTVWEVMTSALADYPHQARILEIWDQDNGQLMLRATNVNFSVTDYPLAAEARALGVLDHVAAWSNLGDGTVTDRNVEIWVASPP